MEHSTSFTHELTPLLRTKRFGRSIRGYRQITSTNTAAMHWASEGAPDGSLVVADEQIAGKGRMGRSWVADAGKNLTFTLVLRPDLPPHRLGLVTLTAGTAVASFLQSFLPAVDVRIKWPNDVLLEGRKCCGMLLESSLGQSGGDRVEAVVLGIGLNVNQDTFPPDMNVPPTSLLLAAGRPFPRAPLLASLLSELEVYYDRLLEGDEAGIRSEYTSMLDRFGERITLRHTQGGEVVTGVLLGIADDGALLLETDNGVRTFYAGDVTTHGVEP